MIGEGLVINGRIFNPPRPEFAPGIRLLNYLAHPELKLKVGRGGDGLDLGDNRGAGADVTSLILHTTKGSVCQAVKPGFSPPVEDGLRCARFWSGADRQSGAHLVVDRDGDIACLADLGRVAAHHCGNSLMNRGSVGIENYQEGERDKFALYMGGLQVQVWLLDVLTYYFGIQRQFHRPYRRRPVKRLDAGGKDCIGVFGHREVSDRRSQGDPGDEIFSLLAAAGYEGYDFDKGEDLEVWRARQKTLGVPQTGVPDVATVRALRLSGRPGGQWIQRPTDPKGV